MLCKFYYKSCTCPLYEMEIVIRGRYVPSDRGTNPFELRFTGGEYPIVANSKLPPHEQNPRLKPLVCTKRTQCRLLWEFEKRIDIRREIPMINSKWW